MVLVFSDLIYPRRLSAGQEAAHDVQTEYRGRGDGVDRRELPCGRADRPLLDVMRLDLRPSTVMTLFRLGREQSIESSLDRERSQRLQD